MRPLWKYLKLPALWISLQSDNLFPVQQEYQIRGGMMSELDYSAAFAENEKEANLYAARCMRVLAVVVSVIWVMNLLHLFIVPPVIMAIAAIGGIVLFLIPTLLLHLIDRDSPRLKLYILL